MLIHSIRDLADLLGNAPQKPVACRRLLEFAGHRLYRLTPHGLGLVACDRDGKTLPRLHPDETFPGVQITGIVEGTDIEQTSGPLVFPFNEGEFWTAAQGVADALDEAKDNWDAQGDDA